MIVVNSPWGPAYQSVLSASFSIGTTGGGIEMKFGVYAASIFSALLGLAILIYALPNTASAKPTDAEDQTRPFISAEPKYEAYEKAKP